MALRFRESIQKEYSFVANKERSKDGIERNRFGFTEEQWNNIEESDKEGFLFLADNKDYPIQNLISDTWEKIKDIIKTFGTI